jgi:3-oxo-5-alpha-steroid 4-dehydrogenase 1
MESVGAVTMLYTLYQTTNTTNNTAATDHGAATVAVFFSLPRWNQLLASLYVLHYINRAVVTPLFVAPSMSPIHIIIICAAATFNYLNSSALVGWLMGYGTVPAGLVLQNSGAAACSNATTIQTLTAYIPYIGLALFLLGMYGNIGAENTLFKLRREEAHRRVAKGEKRAGPDMYSKVYVLPPASGYFRFVLLPHYSLEWLQWFGFMLMGFGVATTTTTTAAISKTDLGAAAAGGDAGPIPVAPYYLPVADFLINKLCLSFPLPAIAFFVNTVLNTAARASWSRKWYVERFGEEAVAGRTAVVPYLL